MKNLNELIPQYGLNKVELDSYKKICDEENKQIKAIMEETGDYDYEVAGWRAKYIIQRRESMNEEKLLHILTSEGVLYAKCEALGIIKTKEYVDFDALENAIYHGYLSQETVQELDKAREVKEVATLKVTRVKEKK